ncbi:MAG: hypothetical protein M1833_002504 [Piccolia ochrophora]|nr:MAG: hypothetical protein M1833_002504 [Piccolia ochrophora]
MSPSAAQKQDRPRTRSMLSFTSNKSDKTHKSTFFQPKINLTESPEEKQRRRFTKSKADPTVALGEREPAAVATDTGSNIEPLRSIQHRDNQGNPIVDPDQSNPTRSRWERPLDTIRAFEAAIDGGYQQKDLNRSRPHNGRQPYENGHPASKMVSRRPESFVDGYYGQHAYQQHPHAQNSYNRSRYNARPNGIGQYEGYNEPRNLYPTQEYQNSYENVTSTSGSATDPWANSTDPSSENSSIDRLQQAPKPDPGDTYGFTGFGGAPQFNPPGVGFSGPSNDFEGRSQNTFHANAPNGTSNDGGLDGQRGARALPPVPPKHDLKSPTAPIKLGRTQPNLERGNSSSTTQGGGEKRKSWFKRLSRAR